MSRSVLVALTVTAFCVAISISNPISSVNKEEAALQELKVATIEALISAFIADIQKEDLAKVAAVNPATFRCSKSSPTGPAVWSNTKPEVALTHIFCGQINKRGEAEGYHSRPNNMQGCSMCKSQQFGTKYISTEMLQEDRSASDF